MENNIQQKEIKKNARQIINENFFGLLKERKISLKEYAKENGLDPSTISKWKSGNSSMNTEELRRAADFLNVTVNDLTYSNEEKKKIDVLSQRDYKPIFAQQSKTIHYLSDLFNKPMQAIIKQLFLFFAFGILCSSIIRFSSYWALLMIAPCLLLYPCFYQQGIGTKKIYIINYLDDIYYQIEKENNQFFLFVLIIRVLIILFGGIFIAFISFYYPDSIYLRLFILLLHCQKISQQVLFPKPCRRRSRSSFSPPTTVSF
jgi:transcriptional regulator with XRE-family HTH domain